MFGSRPPLAGLAMLLLAGARPAGAQTVFANGAPDGVPTGAAGIAGFISADNFTLDQQCTIGAVRFWVLEADDAPEFNGDFDWAFHNNGSGVPGTISSTGFSPTAFRALRTDTPAFSSTFKSLEYRVDLPVGGVTLGPGTYWLALHAGPLSQTSPSRWWETTAPRSGGIARSENLFESGVEWRDAEAHLAFHLLEAGPATVVPEPGSLSLFLPALAALRLRRRRARGEWGRQPAGRMPTRRLGRRCHAAGLPRAALPGSAHPSLGQSDGAPYPAGRMSPLRNRRQARVPPGM